MHLIKDAITGEIIEVPLTEEEIAKGALERIKAERETRDSILVKEVDPIVSNPLRWADLSATEQLKMANYRTALLDVTKQEGYPDNIVWPVL